MKNTANTLFTLLRRLFKEETPKVRRRRHHGCIWRIAPSGEGMPGDGDFDVVRIAPTDSRHSEPISVRRGYLPTFTGIANLSIIERTARIWTASRVW